MSSKIEWTEDTWNPISGCSVASEGCRECYAARDAAGRLSGHPAYAGLAVRDADGRAEFTGEVRVLIGDSAKALGIADRLDQPTRWRRPRRIFVNSMSDLFHPNTPADVIAEIIAEMRRNPRHVFQVLTKRPKRMAEVVAGIEPMAHVLWGTSIELDKYTRRARHLRTLAALGHRTWISAEPLLGPLPSLDLTGIEWVVVGGESGPGARPMSIEWARDLRDRCDARTEPCEIPGVPLPHSVHVDGGGRACACSYPDPVPFLFKQWGEHDAAGVRVGKKAAGRALDGVLHDGYPDAPADRLAL